MCYKKTLTSLLCLTTSSLLYSDRSASDSQTLQDAIVNFANTGIDPTINFTSDIDLTVPFSAPNLRPLNSDPAFNPTSFYHHD